MFQEHSQKPNNTRLTKKILTWPKKPPKKLKQICRERIFLSTISTILSCSNQPSLLSFNVQPTKTTKQRQIKLDTELAFTVAVDNIPLNILRRPRFRQWVESAMNGYQLPGIDRMRNKLIPSVMDKTRLEVRKILQASTSFTIILDIWSSKDMFGSIGFTYVKRMVERHTAENILAEYDQVLRNWNISRSKIMVKTDGGSNMVANTFVNNIPGRNDEEQLPIQDSVLHPPMASTRTSS
ncbi:Uncharacterized protein APZ42_017051, partial [Daphnia magna]